MLITDTIACSESLQAFKNRQINVLKCCLPQKGSIYLHQSFNIYSFHAVRKPNPEKKKGLLSAGNSFFFLLFDYAMKADEDNKMEFCTMIGGYLTRKLVFNFLFLM